MRCAAVLILTVASLASGRAHAATGSEDWPNAAMIQQPDWIRRPSQEDMLRYYPEAALARKVEGRASLSCWMDARGTLQECSVIAETPADVGFGDAALRMTKLYKMRPMTKDGSPVDGARITIPISFRLPRPSGATP